MTDRWRACVIALVTWGGTSPLAAQSLARQLDSLLDAPPLNRHLWGVMVTDTAGHALYRRNADRLFIPASNTKLLVSAAASVLLAPDWTTRTSLYGTGPVVAGVIQGDLVLYGRGDPTMGKRCYAVDTTRAGVCVTDPFAPLRKLADDLVRRGITTVAGDLVGDGSWFERLTVHPSWETGDLPWWYAAPVSGLGFTDNSLELVATPGVVGAPAALTIWPELGNVVIENRTRTVAAGGTRTFDLTRDPAGRHLIATGDVVAGTEPATEYVAVEDPDLYTAQAMRRVLAEAGIAVLGATRSTTDSLTFRDARAASPLAEVESRALRDWIFPVLNTSQNWFAEMLLKQLGRQRTGEGSWSAGLLVVRRFLVDSVGLDSTEVAQTDGSGLSTQNLVAPEAFVTLLSWMRRHPRFDVFAAGLPRSGQPGSLHSRLASPAFAGRVMAKTGSIANVNTLSGYVTRADGKTLVFSIQANHHTLRGKDMITAIDSVVAAIGR